MTDEATLARINKSGPWSGFFGPPGAEESTQCWLWIGSISPQGYGVFRGKGAHVLMWEEENGPVPLGLVLDHVVCQTKNCVRPSHLEPVTHSVNAKRAAWVPYNKGKTYCKIHKYQSCNCIEDGKPGEKGETGGE